jgi:hypothetical protein
MFSEQRSQCTNMVGVVVGQYYMPDRSWLSIQPGDERATLGPHVNDDKASVTEMYDGAIALSHIPEVYV